MLQKQHKNIEKICSLILFCLKIGLWCPWWKFSCTYMQMDGWRAQQTNRLMDWHTLLLRFADTLLTLSRLLFSSKVWHQLQRQISLLCALQIQKTIYGLEAFFQARQFRSILTKVPLLRVEEKVESSYEHFKKNAHNF